VRGVHKATGEEYAIKCIEKHECDTSRLETEVEILQQVEHPNIISLKEVFDTKDTLYLVMEL
jgi:calcium/calmodulin-dependent protein kinase I